MNNLFTAITVDQLIWRWPSIREHALHALLNIALVSLASFGVFSGLAIALHLFL